MSGAKKKPGDQDMCVEGDHGILCFARHREGQKEYLGHKGHESSSRVGVRRNANDADI